MDLDLIILILIILIPVISSIFLYLTAFICSIKQNNCGLTGAEVAESILKNNDIDNIRIGKISGFLSDYYSDRDEVIMLSSSIYDKTTVAAMSVAAHECGHAIQYDKGYLPVRIIDRMVPFVNFSSRVGYIIIVIALSMNIKPLFWPGLILTSFSILFQFIMLPVEFNASKRGKKQLKELGYLDEGDGLLSSMMLLAAGCTYLSSLVVSVLQLLRYVLIILDRSDN